MRLIVVGALLLAGCGGPKGLAECESAIKENLRSPSTYKRVSVGDEVVLDGERTFEIEYDAANAYGTPIREDAACDFDAETGRFIKVEPGLNSTVRMLDDLTGQ